MSTLMTKYYISMASGLVNEIKTRPTQGYFYIDEQTEKQFIKSMCYDTQEEAVTAAMENLKRQANMFAYQYTAVCEKYDKLKDQLQELKC